MRAALLAFVLGFASPALAQTHLGVGPQTTAIEDVTDGGDEDRNDLVVRWAAQCDRNPGNATVRQVVHFAAVSAGASYSNALWLDLPASTSTVTITREGEATQTLTPVGGKVQLYADFRQAFLGAPATEFINTEPGATVVEARTNEVILTFTTPQSFSGCPVPGFELHRGAVVIDDGTFGGGRPLFANVNDTFEVPLEGTDIATGYGRFLAWAADLADNGSCDTECGSPMWFEDGASITGAALFDRPSLLTTAEILPFATCGDGLSSATHPEICGPELVDGLVVFVSSTGLVGGAMGDGGSSYNAFDLTTDHCGSLAAAAGLGGEFVAWLSSDGVPATDRFPVGSGPWYRPDGTLVADDVADLVDGSIAAPISLDETATDVGPTRVWTGTTGTGTQGTTCTNWTQNGAAGVSGDVDATTASWTAAAGGPGCATELPVYCFEIPTRKRIVLTQAAHRADALGGLAGADAICQAEADAVAGFDGVWKAWLSDSGTSAAERLRQWDYGYENVYGNQVAADWAGLTDGTLGATLYGTFAGAAPTTGRAIAWTGTETNGAIGLLGDLCGDWTANTGDGHAGINTATNATWTNNPTHYSCTFTGHLYCVEQ